MDWESGGEGGRENGTQGQQRRNGETDREGGEAERAAGNKGSRKGRQGGTGVEKWRQRRGRGAATDCLPLGKPMLRPPEAGAEERTVAY